MVKVIEEETIENKENETKKKENFKILGISIWRILAYFIIYSFIGYIIETLFGLVKYGTLESRQSFIYGPFCAIYGLGAVIMIMVLQFYTKNYNTLFISGCLLGSVIEYIVSFIGETFLNVKWWDYTGLPFNINGRICLMYSVFWGVLALYLMISLNPKIDKLFEWIKKHVKLKIIKTSVVVISIIFVLDCALTVYALLNYMARMIVENNIEVENMETITQIYENTYSDERKANFVNKFFGNEKMVKTFPRLKVDDKNGNIIYFSELLPDIQPYYYKLNFR